MIQQTTLDAFGLLRPNLNNMQMCVLGAFQACGDLSDYDGAKYANMNINSFVPRRNELVRDGYLIYKGIKKNEIGRSVMLWGLK